MASPRIVVRPHPSYVAGTEDPYHFLYLIEIENLGPGKVQLLHRRWLITDANGKMLEVEGPGVVGEQPFIAPGETFSLEWRTARHPLRRDGRQLYPARRIGAAIRGPHRPFHTGRSQHYQLRFHGELFRR